MHPTSTPSIQGPSPRACSPELATGFGSTATGKIV